MFVCVSYACFSVQSLGKFVCDWQDLALHDVWLGGRGRLYLHQTKLELIFIFYDI
jgi:hypothetical protein